MTTRLTAKTLLVPLTNSLYVPGKLSDTENVIIDVGTGYYVSKVGPSPVFPLPLLRTATDTRRGQETLSTKGRLCQHQPNDPPNNDRDETTKHELSATGAWFAQHFSRLGCS
jgi:hypothetical protein